MAPGYYSSGYLDSHGLLDSDSFSCSPAILPASQSYWWPSYSSDYNLINSPDNSHKQKVPPKGKKLRFSKKT